MKKRDPMRIIVDTKEQKPYDFKRIKAIPPPTLIHASLLSGDYSIKGYENQVSIERKTKSDAYKTFGKGRDRFEAELERLSRFDFAAVVIESEWLGLIRQPPTRSKLQPKTMFVSIVAWCQRYNVHFFTTPGRIFAEKLTYRLLDRYWRDHA